MTKTVTDVICPFCGTLCDDLECDVSDDGKTDPRGLQRLRNRRRKIPAFPGKRPGQSARGLQQPDGTYKEVSYDEAVEYTAQTLAKAKKPLMYGWSSTNCEAQSVGHEIAEKVGAIVDNTAAVCHGPSLIAVQDVGIPSCTLGEVKNRADVVVFWGCNPTHAHPRHMSRYSWVPRGFFVPKGHKNRKLIVVDPRNYRHRQDWQISTCRSNRRRDYELFDALRVAFKGEQLPDVVAGIPKEKIYRGCRNDEGSPVRDHLLRYGGNPVAW